MSKNIQIVVPFLRKRSPNFVTLLVHHTNTLLAVRQISKTVIVSNRCFCFSITIAFVSLNMQRGKRKKTYVQLLVEQ